MKFQRSYGRWLGVAGLGLAGLAVWYGLSRPHLVPAKAAGFAAEAPASPSVALPPPAAPAGVAPAVRSPIAAAQPVFSTAWAAGSRPGLAPFQEWTGRYLAADAAGRPALLPAGVALAQQRRAVMAQLIRTDPRAALAAAVPMVVRQQLPAAVVQLLEDRVSGHGNISLKAVIPAAGQADRETTLRTTLLGRTEYTAYVYGRRDVPATVTHTAMVGIAIDRAFAISESPLRVLESGERAADRPLDPVDPISGTVTSVRADTALNLASPTAVEVDGKVNVLAQPGHVAALERRLLAAETNNLQTAADNQPGSSGVTDRPTSSWTHGTKKVLIILVDFPDLPGRPVNSIGGAPITPDVAVNLFNNPGGVGDFYVGSSYNQTTLQITPTTAGISPDVTPVLRMPATAASYATAGNNDLLHSDARALALAAGYDEANYDRVGVVFSSVSSIANSQITYGGLGEIIGKYFWVNAEYDLRVVAHEIGHNYGLNHANLWKVTDGNPVSPNGTSIEYGDPFDVMGGGGTFQNEFTQWNKSILQWIPDTGVTLAGTAGTYRIYRLDGGAASNLANPRALKIVRDPTRDYWIGYRQNSGNASLNGGADIIWGYNTNQKGNLLDLTTPGVDPGGVHDEGLAVGATFNDSAAGISITPVAQGGSGSEQWLDVQVGFQSSVAWSQGTFIVDGQGGNAVLTIRRNQSSTGAISVNYATADGTAKAPANYTTSTGTVTWADGDTSARTVLIPLVANSLAGGSTANFTVTLSGATGGVIGGSAAAGVSIVAPGGGDGSFTCGFINSSVQKVLPLPDGGIVLGGWFDSVQDAGFNSYNRGGIVRLTAGGAIDLSYATGGGATGGNLYGQGLTVTFDLVRQPDAKTIVVGEFTAFNGTPINRIARLNPDGSLDSTFNPGSGANDAIYAALVQPDGKIVIGGAFTAFNGTAATYLVRLNPDGSVDPTFTGPAFAVGSGWKVESLALQPDGKLLVGGVFYFNSNPFKAGICRVLASGALDPAFNGITAGAHTAASTGSLKNVYRIVVQPDGKILIAGDFSAFNGTANLVGGLARLTATGALDSTFAGPTTADGACNALVLQPDGKILVGGLFTTLGSTTVNHLARFSSTGAFDTTFAAAGGFSETVQDLALLPNGRVLLAGDFGALQGQSGTAPVAQFVSGLPGLPGTIQFGSATWSGNPGGTVALSVSRTGGSLGALTVGYASVNGTATTANYTPASGVLTWADGDTTAKAINFPLTAGSVPAGGLQFAVNLGQPLANPALLGSIQQAVVQIDQVVVPTGFAAWQQANFTSAELSNPALSGPGAVYGSDGLTNLVKYALGLAPKMNASAGLPVASQTATNWVYTYTKPTAVTDLTYTVQVSPDLVNWTVVSQNQIAAASGVETWQATYPTASAPKLFFRLQVSQ